MYVQYRKFNLLGNYLEHAGATLYSEKQLENIFAELSHDVFANPHAQNVASKLTDDIVDQVRYRYVLVTKKGTRISMVLSMR